MISRRSILAALGLAPAMSLVSAAPAEPASITEPPEDGCLQRWVNGRWVPVPFVRLERGRQIDLDFSTTTIVKAEEKTR